MSKKEREKEKRKPKRREKKKRSRSESEARPQHILGFLEKDGRRKRKEKGKEAL